MPQSKVSSIKYFVLSIVFSFLILSVIAIIPAFAQESLEKARADYSFQFSKYREIQKEYQSAKSQYESFKTATSKNEAFLKTKDYQAQIDNLLIAYVLFVNEAGSKVNWQSNAPDRNKITESFEAENSYFKDHREKVQKAQTLEELPPLAKELNEHLNKITFLKIYRALSVYELTHVNSTFDNFNKIYNSLNEYISGKNSGQSNSVISNWQSEMTSITMQAETNFVRAQKKYSQIKQETASKGEYQEISLYSTKTSQELKKTKILFDEILRIL
ncbi:hypothetical protein A2693_03645 [Candidatus Curtissbacteria bacterium RIFCSPHIGHO2_01_FULL_40_12]|uniref:Uncharacterized protein n=1 Tax=Candidatus Curtissbacteria bacterium RIFCSPHIGHO2_01_FULL_40_12 TaxID=1797710 RepID=A0A1F5G9Q8_9BACT|nr:MAG: hypothetical protein A2693_03645 [Candidatus Curtissbacteria bacterium RIFCSPHIGHO2_01_FULL_40_12]